MLEHLIARHGYLLLFGGAMVEGDAFLLGAAVLAHQGQLWLPLVLAVAAAGTVTADQVYYHLARARGLPFLEARAAADPRVERIRRWVERRSTPLLLLARFMYGFRAAIPAACGAVGMPAARFTIVNLLGSAVWAVVVGLAGYALGNAIELVGPRAHVGEGAVAALLLALLAAGAVVGGRDWRQRLSALRGPAGGGLRLAGRVFAAAHRGGGLALARPHVRLAAFVAAVGFLNVATALFHWRFAVVGFLDGWLPIEVAHASRAALLLAGLALVAVARGLSRRKRAAWWMASLAALASVLLHLGHHASIFRAALSAWLLLDLWRHAHRFTARSDPARLRGALASIPVLAAGVLLYGIGGYERLVAGSSAAGAARLTWKAASLRPPLVAGVHGASAFGWSVAALAIASAAYVLGALLAPVAYRKRPGDRLLVSALARAHGSESLSYFAAQGDKSHFVAGPGAFVAYRVARRVAVAVGDPVGEPARIPEAIARFVRMCADNDWVPVFYEASGRWLEAYRAAGLRVMKVGEEALLPLAGFTLRGGKAAKLRQNLSRAERDAPGIDVEEYLPGAKDAEVDEQLEDISAEWLRGKAIGELGFNLGVFSAAELDGKRTMIARTPDGVVWAFVTWVPYAGGRALLLDAMRRRSNAPAFVMDLLIVRSVLRFQQEGLEAVSLATAPLANVDDSAGFSAYDRGVRLVFEHFSSVYGYRSLFQFKKKFNPAWEARYLVFPRLDLLPRVAYALAAVHLEGGLLAALRRLVRAEGGGRRAEGGRPSAEGGGQKAEGTGIGAGRMAGEGGSRIPAAPRPAGEEAG